MEKLLAHNRQLVVPVYQRSYKWKQVNWASLWDDIAEAAEEVEAQLTQETPALSKRPKTHFVGAVVLEPTPRPAGRVEPLQIVDGQQRLTTLQVLFAAANAAANEHGNLRAASGFQGLMYNPDHLVHREPANDRFLVWPSAADREGYLAAMQGASTDGQGGLTAARRYFATVIGTWLSDAGDVNVRLDALHEAVRNRLSLVEILLDEHDDPQVIFENLNYEGQRLSSSDLVKNTLFRLVEQQGDDSRDLHARYWVPFDGDRWQADATTGRITRNRLDVFLAHWLTATSAQEISVDRFFAEFRSWLSTADRTAAEVIADIRYYATIYERLEALPLSDPGGALWTRISKLNTNTVVPLLLHLYGRKDVPDEQLHLAVRSLDSYLMRRMVCRMTSKDYNKMFVDMLRLIVDIEDDRVGRAVYMYLMAQTAASRVWPDDETVADMLSDYGVYQRLKWRARVMLVGIENHLRTRRTEHLLDDNGLSIEHLLPQKWEDHYPLPTGVNDDVLRERAHALDSLGNLTLCTQPLNSAASNGAWGEKVEQLRQNSVLLLTSGSVLAPPPGRPQDAWAQYWHEPQIAVRNSYLIEVFLDAWSRRGIAT